MFSIPVEDQHDEPKDLSSENEELKEEIQKLASQIQYLRIVGMLTANFHIKNKKEGYFSEENAVKLFQQNLETCLQVWDKSIFGLRWDQANIPLHQNGAFATKRKLKESVKF